MPHIINPQHRLETEKSTPKVPARHLKIYASLPFPFSSQYQNRKPTSSDRHQQKQAIPERLGIPSARTRTKKNHVFRDQLLRLQTTRQCVLATSPPLPLPPLPKPYQLTRTPPPPQRARRALPPNHPPQQSRPRRQHSLQMRLHAPTRRPRNTLPIHLHQTPGLLRHPRLPLQPVRQPGPGLQRRHPGILYPQLRRLLPRAGKDGCEWGEGGAGVGVVEEGEAGGHGVEEG